MDTATLVNYSEAGREMFHSGEGNLVNVSLVGVQHLPVSRNHDSSETFQECSVVFRFAVYTVIIGTTCLLGIAGNTLSIIVLQKDKGNKVANLLLQALAVADNSLLVTSFVLLSIVWGALEYFEATSTFEAWTPYLLIYVQPVGNMTKTFAIWMTVLLAINRYIVIKRPLEAQRICTIWKVRIQIIAVLLFSIACDFPRFFTHVFTTKEDGKIWFKESSSLGRKSLFHIIYTNVLYTLLVWILPLVLIVVMNVCLVLELKKMKTQREGMNVSGQPMDHNITLVMCIIIVIFIVCHTPDRINEGIQSFLGNGWWVHSCYLSALCNFLIVINSSVNFLVYYFVRKRFRKLLYTTLCRTFSRQSSGSSAQASFAPNQNHQKRNPEIAMRRISDSMSRLLNKQARNNDARDGNEGQRNSKGDSPDENQTRKANTKPEYKKEDTSTTNALLEQNSLNHDKCDSATHPEPDDAGPTISLV